MRGLFIGIGGTGDIILTYLKDKVYASMGGIPDTLQFRLIDTEAEEFRKNRAKEIGEEGTGSSITSMEYLQLQDDPPGTFYAKTNEVQRRSSSTEKIYSWFRADQFLKNLGEADFNMVRGAGQHRQFARVGAFLNRQRLQNMLTNALTKCHSADAEIPIWIVGSVAGGTGAGLFMDIALLARWAVGSVRARSWVVGVAVLPEVFNDLNINPARAYAVIREIDRFQSPVDTNYRGSDKNGKEFRFAASYDSSVTVQLEGRLFDSLVFYNRRCENEEQRRSYFSQIADGLNLLLDEAVGDNFFRQWINAQEGYAASFNSFRVFIPAALYRRQFTLEAALEIIDGLLPRDANQALLFGSTDDRFNEAREILGEELGFFGPLLKLNTQNEMDNFSRGLTAEYIVQTIMGFNNPIGRFDRDIGEDLELSAKRLHADIFKPIDTVESVKESFEDSKIRVKLEVGKFKKVYNGDGEGSYEAALATVRPLIEEYLEMKIDASARGYLTSIRAKEQTLGKAHRVFTETRNLLSNAVGANLTRIIAKDKAALESRIERETNAFSAMEELDKPLLRWRGKLAEKEKDYLTAARDVVHWQQRMRLGEFLHNLIEFAHRRFTYWLNNMQGWIENLTEVRKICQDENNLILQLLNQQTRIDSASMGLNNTIDMNGYREFLREKCTLDPDNNEPFVPLILQNFSWAVETNGHGLTLTGWPDAQSGVEPANFRNALDNLLKERIGKRMDGFEGMANYLVWLRDVKRLQVTRLVEDKLLQVIHGFVDSNSNSATRKALFLYGDNWEGHKSQDEFVQLFNALNQYPDFAGKVVNNLTDDRGIQLFKDRNAMAVLMSDAEIPYANIPIITQMREAYFDVRGKSNLPWRAYTHHIFRCDQEAWAIERDQVKETRAIDFPPIPGEFVRLLDEPERVALFAKALATGVIHQIEVPLGGKVWVCSPEDDERNLIYLNDPENGEHRDLHRALVTFVLDQRDIRPNISGRLDIQIVSGWIKDRVSQQGTSMNDLIQRFKNDNQDLVRFDPINLESANENESARGFLALVLNYYLKKV